jgi:hypothetical protein
MRKSLISLRKIVLALLAKKRIVVNVVSNNACYRTWRMNMFVDIKFNDTERFAYVYVDGKFSYKTTGFAWSDMLKTQWDALKAYVKCEDDLKAVINW